MYKVGGGGNCSCWQAEEDWQNTASADMHVTGVYFQNRVKWRAIDWFGVNPAVPEIKWMMMRSYNTWQWQYFRCIM